MELSTVCQGFVSTTLKLQQNHITTYSDFGLTGRIAYLSNLYTFEFVTSFPGGFRLLPTTAPQMHFTIFQSSRLYKANTGQFQLVKRNSDMPSRVAPETFSLDSRELLGK
jgi:hypothetical protein